jgi:uncharacterized RDD family membrane protein YckC
MSQDNPYAPPIDMSPVERGRPDALPLASRSARLAATLVDGLLLGACVVPYLVVIAILVDWRNTAASLRGLVVAPWGPLLSLLAVVLPLSLVVYQWYLIATSGQTLGKRWLGVRIVRLDGSAVGFVRGVMIRNWVVRMLTLAAAFVPYVGGTLWLLDVMLIFREDHRCLHDQLAGTNVVLDA